MIKYKIEEMKDLSNAIVHNNSWEVENANIESPEYEAGVQAACNELQTYIDTYSLEDGTELFGQIIDVFEDFITAKGITIENKERDEEEHLECDDSFANIYGDDYYELEDKLKGIFINWNIFPNKNKEEQYTLLDRTKKIVNVEVEDIANAYVDSQIRGYNVEDIHFFDTYISIAAPHPKTGFGQNMTLVCDIDSQKQIYQDLLYCIVSKSKDEGYNWAICDARNNLNKMILKSGKYE